MSTRDRIQQINKMIVCKYNLREHNSKKGWYYNPVSGEYVSIRNKWKWKIVDSILSEENYQEVLKKRTYVLELYYREKHSPSDSSVKVVVSSDLEKFKMKVMWYFNNIANIGRDCVGLYSIKLNGVWLHPAIAMGLIWYPLLRGKVIPTLNKAGKKEMNVGYKFAPSGTIKKKVGDNSGVHGCKWG